ARIEIARPSMRLTQAAVGAEEAPDLLPRRAFAGDDALHDRIARWNMELDPLRRRRGLGAAGIEHASIGVADEGCIDAGMTAQQAGELAQALPVGRDAGLRRKFRLLAQRLAERDDEAQIVAQEARDGG